MLQFVATQGDGRPMVGVGLSRENTRRLLKGEPITVELSKFNIGWDGTLFLMGGETEEAMGKTLVGLIGPGTEVHIDPRIRDPRD